MTSFLKLLVTSALPLACASLVACGPIDVGGPTNAVGMADSFDIDFFGAHADDLHTPYVAGAEFGISILADASRDQAGWTLSSSDPNVMQVTSSLSGGGATVVAAAPGQATLSVLDATGHVLDAHVVTVAIPDQVSLYAEGLLVTGASDQAAQVSQASVVAGGQATFLVRYFSQGTELYGSGAATTTTNGQVQAAIVSQSFASDRDFLQVTPAPMGSSGTVSLVIDHTVVTQIPITTVEPSAVASITILPQSSAGAANGDSLVLYAHAVDENSSDVYGASFQWSINGASQAGTGESADDPADLFFYAFSSGALETVGASFQTFSQDTTVHGQGGSVESTATPIGCSLAAMPGEESHAPAFAGLGLGIIVLGLVRRRVTRAA